MKRDQWYLMRINKDVLHSLHCLFPFGAKVKMKLLSKSKVTFTLIANVKKNSLQDCSHCILHVDIFLTSSISVISPSQSQKISNNCFRIIVFHCGEPNF